MKRKWIISAMAAAALLFWGGYMAWRAHQKLVTLNVREMDVREVAKRIEWQTWERILVNRDVGGRVTLNVHAAPLEEVLNIVCLQTYTRWTALYPLYSSGQSLDRFKKLARGDLAPAAAGWTNLFTTPSWRRGGTGGFANNARAGNRLVSARLNYKDLGFASLALSRFAQAQVVPEDGADGNVSVKWEQTPFAQAVAQVARQVHRKWDRLYTIQPQYRVIVGPAPPGSGGTGAALQAWAPPLMGDTVSLKEIAGSLSNQPPARTNDTDAQQAAATERQRQAQSDRAAAREREFEAQLATMTPAEQTQAWQQRQALEELRQLPPEEQKQRLQEMAAQVDPQHLDLQQRMLNRLKNLTPDQRVDRDRDRLARQKTQPK